MVCVAAGLVAFRFERCLLWLCIGFVPVVGLFGVWVVVFDAL